MLVDNAVEGAQLQETESLHQIESLADTGAHQELREFYAKSLKCEREMLCVTYRMLREMRDKVLETGVVLNTIQTIANKFNVWKQVLDDLDSLQQSFPPSKVDISKLHSTHPGKLSAHKTQVCSESGQEGSKQDTIVTTPDCKSATTIKRLQIHLLTYWFDCDSKIAASLRANLNNLLPKIDKLKENKDIDSGGLINWQSHVTKLGETLDEKSYKSWVRVRDALGQLEDQINLQENTDSQSLTRIISDLKTSVLHYMAFHDDRCRLQKKLERSACRPIVFHSSMTKADIHRRGRQRSYYEIKLTSLDTVVTEEIVFLSSNNNKRVASQDGGEIQDGSTCERTETEELTSVSHEENVKFVVRGVIDPRDGKEITIEQAVSAGIVNHQQGIFTNPNTGEQWPIAAAMNDGRIRVERTVKSRSAEQKRSIGIITIRTETDTREYTITGAIDLATGSKVSAEEARERNIIDEAGGYFYNTKTNERTSLSDAVDAGLVLAEFELDGGGTSDSSSGFPQCEMKSFAVSGVVDQVEKKPVPFDVAIRRGLIDRQTGCYVNNATGERVLTSEAIKRGFFKCSPVDESMSLTDIDSSNRVTVDRIQHIRRNVLRGVKAMAAFRK